MTKHTPAAEWTQSSREHNSVTIKSLRTKIVSCTMNITPDLRFLNIHNPFTNERISYTWTNIDACL